jgi:hypothetical protein
MSQYQPPAYQPPQGYQPPPQPPYPYHPQQQVQHVVHHYQQPPRSPGTAALLEILPGFFQVFGIGHIYAGNVGLGLLFMFGYWFVAFINFLLIFIIIGLFTGPLCWLAMMIISSVTASNAATRSNNAAGYR